MTHTLTHVMIAWCLLHCLHDDDDDPEEQQEGVTCQRDDVYMAFLMTCASP